jgi:ferric enterobactin receptor
VAPTGPGVVRGVVVDETQHPVGGGSVTIRNNATKAFVSGGLIAPDGNFRIDGLLPGNYLVSVRSLGYVPFEKTGVAITPAAATIDLGSITLTRAVVTLGAQTTTAERSETVLSPDRNTYSMKNMPAVAGGTTIDALRATPGVEVDANDNVSLRGNSNVVVQINGRATPLNGDQLATFLKQIPAAQLDRIEVATNPSAKNDPEGTAGIINIVLKQEVDVGLSGGINASVATSGRVNASGNVARQTGPWTLFASVFGFEDHRTMTAFLDRTNLTSATPASLLSTTDAKQHPRAVGSNLKAEYKFTGKDIVAAEGFLFDNRFAADLSGGYQEFNAGDTQVGAYTQAIRRRFSGSSQDVTLNYRHAVSPQLTPFLTELHYSRFGNTSDSRLTALVTQADPGYSGFQSDSTRDYTVNGYPTWVWQTDVTKPVGDVFKFEGGEKSTWRRTENNQTSWRPDTATGAMVEQPSLANNFDYHEDFHALYGVFSEKLKMFTLQEGLRGELTSTDLRILNSLRGADEKRLYGSLFPSGIITWNASQFRSVKLSYSRRISRPFPQNLSPVPFQFDQRNIFVGNPDLQPEYTDAYEVTLQDTHPWGVVQLTPFVRQTNNASRQIRTIDTLGIATTRPANVASVITRGADVNLSLHQGPAQLSIGGSAYRYHSDAGNLGPLYSVTTNVWNARANGNFKLDKVTTAQFFAFYRPATRQEGQQSLAGGFAGMGVRRNFDNGKGSVSLNVQDPFKWQRFGTRLDNGQVIELNRTTFTSRTVSITLSRTFGSDIKFHQRATDVDQAPQQPAGSGPP